MTELANQDNLQTATCVRCAVVFFSPFIFQGLGGRFSGEFGSLVASAIVGAVQVCNKFFSPFYCTLAPAGCCDRI